MKIRNPGLNLKFLFILVVFIYQAAGSFKLCVQNQCSQQFMACTFVQQCVGNLQKEMECILDQNPNQYTLIQMTKTQIQQLHIECGQSLVPNNYIQNLFICFSLCGKDDKNTNSTVPVSSNSTDTQDSGTLNSTSTTNTSNSSNSSGPISELDNRYLLSVCLFSQCLEDVIPCTLNNKCFDSLEIVRNCYAANCPWINNDDLLLYVDKSVLQVCFQGCVELANMNKASSEYQQINRYVNCSIQCGEAVDIQQSNQSLTLEQIDQEAEKIFNNIKQSGQIDYVDNYYQTQTEKQRMKNAAVDAKNNASIGVADNTADYLSYNKSMEADNRFSNCLLNNCQYYIQKCIRDFRCTDSLNTEMQCWYESCSGFLDFKNLEVNNYIDIQRCREICKTQEKKISVYHDSYLNCYKSCSLEPFLLRNNNCVKLKCMTSHNDCLQDTQCRIQMNNAFTCWVNECQINPQVYLNANGSQTDNETLSFFTNDIQKCQQICPFTNTAYLKTLFECSEGCGDNQLDQQQLKQPLNSNICRDYQQKCLSNPFCQNYQIRQELCWQNQCAINITNLSEMKENKPCMSQCQTEDQSSSLQIWNQLKICLYQSDSVLMYQLKITLIFSIFILFY